MQCPKCGHRQREENECGKCGIIFSKYSKFQKKKQGELAAAQGPVSGGKVGLLLTVLLVLGLATGGFFYFNGQNKIGQLPNQQVPAQEPSALARQSATDAPPPTTSTVDGQTRKDTASDGLAGQLAVARPTGNSIEHARNATVSIVSPWGRGAGFFVDSNGTIVTNRHVVEFDSDQLAMIKRQASELKARLDNERSNLNLTRKRLGQIRDAEVRKQVVKNIRLREEQYSKYQQHHAAMEEQIATIEQKSFRREGKVVLIDGTEYQVGSFKVSPTHDLALLSILVYNSPFIQAVDNGRYPDQGQRVYTIGSPVGLSHTVTSGIISGYRQYKEERFIQTDAPINPGNSGGPLIDEQGRVLGVNTMIINNTEGIGFAIPMSTVHETFPELDN